MRFTRKKFAALAVGTLTLGVSVGAYAYFTAPGAGSATATVGSASNIELNGTTTDAVYPGGPAVDVAISVHNPGEGAQHVDTVTLDSIDTPTGCAASAFSMAPVPVDTTVAPGATTTVHGTLLMADSGNQDSCQGAALTLHLTSN